MMNDLDPRFLLSILLRRFPIFLLTAVLIFSGFAATAVLLPATYTSNARILVESQQIPTNLVQSTVGSNATERLRVIEQRLMTRENLLEIANRFNVFADRRDLSPSQIVAEMRSATSFRVVSLGGGRGGGGALIFNMSFSNPNPQIAGRVVGEYVTRILEDNLRLRTARAAETFGFFEQESQRLLGELAAIESEIVEFKRSNRSTLPETLPSRANQLERVQQRQQLLDRERAELREKRKLLNEMRERPEMLLSTERRLSQAEQELADLETRRRVRLALLSETHPEIRALDVRIGALMRVIDSEAAERAAGRESRDAEVISEQLARINQEVELIDTRLDQVRDELANLERLETELDRSISETPNTQMALNALQRNYGALQSQYDNARSKLAVSATGEQLELKQQAERFEVIEQATVPERPDKPNRLLILAMGVGGGAGAGLGLVFLLEFLNRSIRRPSDIVAALEVQPLGVIPYIYTDAELRRKSLLKWSAIIIGVGGTAAALILTHFFYLPLDLLTRRLMEATSVDLVLELVRSRLKL